MKTNYILILISFLTCLRLVGQDTTYYYTFGTIGTDDVIEIVESPTNYFLFGSTGGLTDGNPDVYIIKLDKRFENPVFKSYGTTDIERLIALDYSNNEDFILFSQAYHI
jgi:hypothetical protein